jgi:hypothetical protein
LKYQVRERPRWIFCGAIVVSAILMVMVIPFSYTHTAGYQVTFPVMASESRVPPRLVAAALTTIGYENVTLSPSAGGSSNAYAVRKLESPGEAESVAALFSAMTGHQGKPKIEPVVVKVSTTLYSQAVEKLKPRRRIPLRIENRDGGEVIINGRRIRDVVFDTELSDARIEEEMRKIFGEEDQEAEDIKVTVETNAGKTERTVRVELFPEQPKPEGKVPTISIGLKRKSMSIFLVKADDSVSAEAGPAFELGLADKKAEAKIHKMRFRVIEFRIDLQ